MRRLILLLLLVILTLVISLQFGQIGKFLGAVENGQPLWIVAAVVMQLAWQALQVGQFRATHELAGSSQSWRAILPVALANNFIVVAAPSGSVSTFALFVADAKRRGLSASAVVLGVMLFAVAEYSAICVLLGIDLVELFGQHLFVVVLTPALIIFGVTGVFVGFVWLGIHSPARLIYWLTRTVRPVNRLARWFKRPDIVTEESLTAFANTIVNDFAALREKPKADWLRPLAVAIAAKLGLIMLFGIVCLAFDHALPWPDLLTSVTVALAYTVVSPTPLGIGVAEGAIIYTLVTLGVPNEQAILISLTYRGFTLWLPMVYGFIVLEWTGMRAAASS